ncbi:MAG TPA: hypothetical protein VH300_18455 [Thermoleophilaceae bacterium]|nr:hypothetical protein [Thermoleophilaceae bacterium]
MARSKSKSDQAKIAARRLVEDEEVQKHLRLAATRLREAWGRVSGRSVSKAASDKKLYSKVREAATSLAAAGGRLRKQPEPPKRTGRKVVAAAAVAGGTAVAVKKLRDSQSTNGADSVVATPAAYPDRPVPVA